MKRLVLFTVIVFITVSIPFKHSDTILFRNCWRIYGKVIFIKIVVPLVIFVFYCYCTDALLAGLSTRIIYPECGTGWQ